MKLRPFAGFQTYSTQHCVTGSMKHIYDFHGHPVSEDLLLGLGRGLGFIYFHIAGADPFYGGRANNASRSEEGLELTAGRRTGVSVRTHVTSSARRAEQELRELLEAGEPVMVGLDMGFLPYFDLPEGYHFGGHVVVVAGYDPGTRQVLVADRDRNLHTLDWSVLEQARGSTFKPFPPAHRYHTFDFSAARPPTADEVRTAIGEVCHGMLAPPISNLGVDGIRKAVRETSKWPELLDPAALRRTCFNTALMIDPRGGTGGGIFRYMYGRFLGEAARITGDVRAAAMGAELAGIGDRWEAVAAIFAKAAEAPQPAALLAETARPMREIADREQDFWERLQTVGAG